MCLSVCVSVPLFGFDGWELKKVDLKKWGPVRVGLGWVGQAAASLNAGPRPLLPPAR